MNSFNPPPMEPSASQHFFWPPKAGHPRTFFIPPVLENYAVRISRFFYVASQFPHIFFVPLSPPWRAATRVLQRPIIRILLMVPVYGITSILSLSFKTYSIYIDLARGQRGAAINQNQAFFLEFADHVIA